MSDEQIRIAIAEACGWKDISRLTWPDGAVTLNGTLDYKSLNLLPDYLSDLNACAEFEKMLTADQHYTYRCRLWELTEGEVNGEEHNRRYCSATARQRSIAFLRALNLYTESPNVETKE